MSFSLIFISFALWVNLCQCSINTKSFNFTAAGFRVKSEIVNKLEGQLLSTCAMACAHDHSLVAFNFSPANGSCEIIRKPSETAVGNLVSDGQYNFYNSLHPCDPNPCKYRSTCLATLDGMDYKCDNCKYFLRGKNCSELPVDDKPHKSIFSINDTIYVIHMAPEPTWKAAYENCQSSNYDIALIKNQDVHDFLKPKLLAWVGLRDVQDTSYPYLMWIGLNRTSEESGWMWADGTPLGDYVGWEGQAQDGLCAALHFNTTDYYWHSSSCDAKYAGYTFYVLCQLN